MRNVRSVLPLKTAKTGNLVLAGCTVLFGFVLLIYPEAGIRAVGSVAGWLLLATGIFKLFGYFSKDLYRLAFQFDLVFGLLLTALGVFVLTKPSGLLHILCTAAGLTVTADGLVRIKTAADAKRFGLKSWWAVLLSGVLSGICGLILLCFPSESSRTLVRLIGLAMAAEGLLNLITVLMTVRIIRHQKPDIIDISVQS